jgi:CheY-like chemotaxis protein
MSSEDAARSGAAEARENHRRVLVVDDEEVIRDLVVRMLAPEPYEVTTAPDASSAVELLQTRDFDVALLDLVMPGQLDGFDVLREARRLQPMCRVVLMTGYVGDEKPSSCMRQGDARLMKPFLRDALLACLAPTD